MNIRVNGEVKTIAPGVSVQELLVQMNIVPENVVIEHNGIIVPRQEWPSVFLQENDSLEIVLFMGGGSCGL